MSLHLAEFHASLNNVSFDCFAISAPKKLPNMMFPVPRTQIINMFNIKQVHHLLLSCHSVGNHVSNPSACFFQFTQVFLHRDASGLDMEKNYKYL